jgi:hypothetical protein
MKSNRANIIAASIYLPFGHLWYGEPKAVSNAIACAKYRSRSRHFVIRVYDIWLARSHHSQMAVWVTMRRAI